MTQAEMIVSIREQRQISQVDLAQVLKVHPQFISNIERGVCSVPFKHIKTLVKNGYVSKSEVVNILVGEYREGLEESL